MDLHPVDALPTDEERAAVDEVLGPPHSGWQGGERRADLEGHLARGGHEARARRDQLLPALHAVQDRVGWISEGALGYICRRLTVPPAEAYGVASFYALFSHEPRPPTVFHVCDDIACLANGARELCDQIEGRFGSPGSPMANGQATWKRSPCVGLCEKAPAVFVQRAEGRPDAVIGRAQPSDLTPDMGEGVSQRDDAVTTTRLSAPQAFTADPTLRLLRRVHRVSPTSVDEYRAHGGYEALRLAFELGPEGVIREVKESKLLGRGGAAFPTGVKWEAVAKQAVRPHYFVCNADESEPGTFKDRVLMEHDPFAVIEAVTIAGFATGSDRGYVYLRGEYPAARLALSLAIDQARARGFLGDGVMGDGFAFDIELRRGAGAYIAGEETALFNSIEGKRPEPRNKPPFPVTHGLFGKPTGVNNVETLVNVLEILRIGGAAYAETGTPDSTGTRLFCLSGSVERPGVYEVEFGTTLRGLLDLAGGVRGGRSLQAVLLGGAAGSFLTPDQLDLPLTFEDTKAAGVALGSGVVMVFDETVDLDSICLRIARFFRDESCGQCVPCRVGTVRQEELLHRLARGTPLGSREAELNLLSDIAQAMRDASICGLGQTASGAIQSAMSKLGVFNGGGAR
jgi:NADH-quinone oxidoreductase subunit F